MQHFVEAVRIALAAIWAAKLRSFMTVLGNVVAVTSIIAVVSIVRGMNAYVSDAIVSDLGANSFTITRRGITTSQEDEERTRNNPRVTARDAEALRRFSTSVSRVLVGANRSASVVYRDNRVDNVRVQGLSREYVEFGGYTASRGRLLTPAEIDRDRPVVYLGWGAADRLFAERNPVDEVVLVDGVHFRVVGVNEKKGSLFGNSQDEFAIIPLGMHEKLFGVRQSLSLTVRPRTPELLQAAMDESRVALRVERKLKAKTPDNFGVLTSDTVLGIYHTMTNGIFAVLIGVVALSLVVGGIVIMNIMLMVVSERTREIGLRKALGARKRDILWQILVESTTLSILGGVVGTTLGFGAALIIGRVSPLPARVEPWSIALGIGITGIVGVFFGLYPALRAARLDPIEALRRE
ncbi:MAG: ABC transporter permease [Vicinamibacterales bacterium]